LLIIRGKYNLLLGQPTAEDIKIVIGSAVSGREGGYQAAGRDLTTGLPNALTIEAEAVYKALANPLRGITEAIKDTIEETPPELISDLLKRGITLAGGGAQLWGLTELVAAETGLPVTIADDPITAVVRGTGMLLQEERLLRKVQILSQKVS